MFSPSLHRRQARYLPTPDAVISRRCLRLTPAMLIDGLPALGSVLYVPMRPCLSAIWEMPRGLLVEAMQLMPLMLTHWIVLACIITNEGPREWIECVDRDGRQCARLHLLPDTDYLAWEALLASGEPATVPGFVRWPSDPRPAGAQLLRFHLRRLAGLHVLAGEVTPQVSILSKHLAARIAHAEAVSLQP